MKHSTRSRIAAAALVSALGVGTLSWGLRAVPAARKAMARLRGPGSARSSDGPDAISAVAQNAFLVSGSTGAGVGATLVSLSSGTFSGRREYAYYGYIRVQATVKNGTLADIKILEFPNDNGRSHYINTIALPYLVQEAVDAQSWKVDLISGATFTSVAFERSLQAALKQAGA